MRHKVNEQATQETINVISITLWNQKKTYYTFKYQYQFFRRNTDCVLPVT